MPVPISVDAVTAYSSGDWRHFNAYAYGFNNPYRFTDPDGRAPLDKEEKDFKREVIQEKQEHREKVASQEAIQPVVPEAIVLPAMRLPQMIATVKEVLNQPIVSKADGPYSRPLNATTRAQRESVQGSLV